MIKVYKRSTLPHPDDFEYGDLCRTPNGTFRLEYGWRVLIQDPWEATSLGDDPVHVDRYGSLGSPNPEYGTIVMDEAGVVWHLMREWREVKLIEWPGFQVR